MSKKFDIKRTLSSPTPPLSIEAVEEMTRLIHDKRQPIETRIVYQPAPEKSLPAPKTSPAKVAKTKAKKVQKGKIETPKYEKTTAEPAASKRGRKPRTIVETERLLRVSVDLPESVFIKLKVLVIQQKTDMKTYVRKLVEQNLDI